MTNIVHLLKTRITMSVLECVIKTNVDNRAVCVPRGLGLAPIGGNLLVKSLRTLLCSFVKERSVAMRLVILDHSTKSIFSICDNVSYITQLSFTISQNYFVDFYYVFRNNCWFFATRAFSNNSVYTTAFKFGISVDDFLFPWCRVPITLIKPQLCFNSIFPLKSNFWLTLSFLSIVLKMAKVILLKPL